MTTPSYPLIPVRAMLCTNQRWKSRNTINTGMVTIEAKASKSPHNFGSCPKKDWMPTVRGRTSIPRVTIKGHMNRFQAASACRMATVAKIGLESGSTMFQKIRNRLAPSTSAASSRSFGKPMKNW